MITIPNLSFKTKKYLLCIFLIVQLLVFIWRQRVYFRFVMSIVPSPFVSLILISSQFLILVSKHMYTWQKRWFCDMLICSFVHFYFYVNIYSLLSSLHWFLKYQKKILPKCATVHWNYGPPPWKIFSFTASSLLEISLNIPFLYLEAQALFS